MLPICSPGAVCVTRRSGERQDGGDLGTSEIAVLCGGEMKSRKQVRQDKKEES